MLSFQIVRIVFFVVSLLLFSLVSVGTYFWPPISLAFVVVGPLIGLGCYDASQTQHAVLRNFPVIGHGRYLMEMIRPEVSQYFIELDTNGRPFNREERSLVYQRAKGVTDTLPFGTRQEVYSVGYEWLNYSLSPAPVLQEEPRILIGGPACSQPYAASLFNISAMSFGALSKNAIRALNGAATLGGFAHNTGEGGLSPYHLEPGGDLIWQIGTGYFGCRTKDGHFDPVAFHAKARLSQVKMIEVKLSQGAKPGHGGMLPGAKVSAEIAPIRNVEAGKTVFSPAAHTAFSNPVGLLAFVAHLRELSGGKPIGLKLCVGRREEFFAICKAMLKTDILPDFVTIDAAEGGTGAAPLEFSNSVGMPLDDGLVFVHNALTGIGLRDQIRLIASGRILSGFDIMGRRVSAQELLCQELLPLADEGLRSAGIAVSDIDRYLGILTERVRCGRTGSHWLVTSLSNMQAKDAKDVLLSALTAATALKQWEGKPVHEWTAARPEEGRAEKPHALRIEECMTTDLFTVHPDEPFELVVNLMDWEQVRHIPVEDEQGKLAGMISWLEVIRYSGRRPGHPQTEPIAVSAVMDTHPTAICPETPVRDAVALMRQEKLDSLLVVKDGRLVGIVTERDILTITARLLESEQYGAPSTAS